MALVKRDAHKKLSLLSLLSLKTTLCAFFLAFILTTIETIETIFFLIEIFVLTTIGTIFFMCYGRTKPAHKKLSLLSLLSLKTAQGSVVSAFIVLKIDVVFFICKSA